MKIYETILDILETQGPTTIPLICQEISKRTNVSSMPAPELAQSFIKALILRKAEIFSLRDGIVSIRPERDPDMLVAVYHAYPGPELRVNVNFKRKTFTYFEWHLDSNTSKPLKITLPGKIDDFKKELYLLKIWDWKEDYQSEGIIVDGNSWSVRLVTKGFIYESGGLNDYPANWKEFIQAISSLIGIQFPGKVLKTKQ